MKYILVTGSCGGIGKAVTVKFLENGYYVFGLDLSNDGFSHERFKFIATDITSIESVKHAYESVSSITNQLDCVINTAGIVYMGSLVEENSEYMKKILDINVSGVARVNNVFFPLIETAKGRYINFSSEYGKFCSMPFHGFYTASKHALEAYNDSLRREMKYLNIKVIAIRPGAVDTPMTQNTAHAFKNITETTTHFLKTYKKLYPLMVGATKHPVSPRYIADVVFKVATCKNPKRFYNISQDKRVKLLSLLPSWLTDFIFKYFI